MRYRKNKTINVFYVKKRIEVMFCFPHKKFCTLFYHTICDFSKKSLTQKISKT